MNRRWSTISITTDAASNYRLTTSSKVAGNKRSEGLLSFLCQQTPRPQQQGQQRRQTSWQNHSRKPCPSHSLAHGYPQAHPYGLTLLRSQAIVHPISRI